ncbi:MAG: peptidoglycan DD-metalloendopeptidase family protein, partial [Gammaproteobacteria bacterium]|nr:peptidoglycan DD-metalloendopeptidase family protein [Gammaproteobacteria bacterium]
RLVIVFHTALLVLTLLLTGSIAAPALAAKDTEVKTKAAQLDKLRKRIGVLKQELEDVRGTRDARQAALERTDKAISGLIAELRITRTRVSDAERQLAVLEKEQQAERRKLAAMRAQLKQEVRASYMAGRQERVKLLLNQEDPAAVARMLVYQGYFTRARTGRIQDFHETLARLGEREQVLLERRASLEALYREQQAQTDSLTGEQARQHQLLVEIEKQLGDKTDELKSLQQDEQRLGKLVEKLRRALLDVPLGELDKPLKSLKGKLSWPVTGRVTRNYGEKQGVGDARSRGLTIATRADTDVHAIAKGRVAFADWLRGFGLLMIIEHGDGYMSLYGRNNSLYKGVGEWVERGEVIAAAGNSGGQRNSALYLELRRNGRPVDPRSWFRGKPRARSAAR